MLRQGYTDVTPRLKIEAHVPCQVAFVVLNSRFPIDVLFKSSSQVPQVYADVGKLADGYLCTTFWH
jgi:hypothetical protein